MSIFHSFRFFYHIFSCQLQFFYVSSYCYCVLESHYALLFIEISVRHVQNILYKLFFNWWYHIYHRFGLDLFLYGSKIKHIVHIDFWCTLNRDHLFILYHFYLICAPMKQWGGKHVGSKINDRDLIYVPTDYAHIYFCNKAYFHDTYLQACYFLD